MDGGIANGFSRYLSKIACAIDELQKVHSIAYTQGTIEDYLDVYEKRLTSIADDLVKARLQCGVMRKSVEKKEENNNGKRANGSQGEQTGNHD